MQVQQHTNTSRLTEWAQEQSLSQLNPSQLTANHIQHSQQSKKLKHIPMSKLSLNCIFVKKQHEKNLYKQKLSSQNKSIHNYFYEMRQNYESDIYAFMKKYEGKNDAIDEIEMDQSVSQISSQYLKRQSTNEDANGKVYFRKMTQGSISSPSKSKQSSKRVNESGYFWNNWRSYESYPCLKAINEPPKSQHSISLINDQCIQNLSAHLVYSVIDMDFDRALRIIDSITQIYYNQDRCHHKLSSGVTNSIHGAKHVIEIIVSSDKSSPTLQKQSTNKSTSTNNKSHIKNLKENSLNLKSLRIIIKGLKTLSSIIKLTDQLNNNSQLSQTFFYRDQFHLLEDHYLNDSKAKINLLNINVQEIESSGYFRQNSESAQNQDSYDNNMNNNKDRKKFEKKPSYNLTSQSPKPQRKTMKSTQNLINFKNSPKKPKSIQQLKSFLQLQSKFQKICILNNLMFLINFSKKIRIETCQNDYFKLLFCYLKNGQDQQVESLSLQGYIHMYSQTKKQSEDFIRLSPLLQQEDLSNLSQTSLIKAIPINYRHQVDYMILLLSLPNLQIFDRINFATRLLSKPKKIKFVSEIQSKILKFHSLDNLLLFTKFYRQEMNKSLSDTNIIDYPKQSKEPLQKMRKNSTDGFHKWSTLHQFQKQRTLAKQKVQQNLQIRDVLATKMRTICQNYIDQSGDLATIAYLSIQFQCLQKYFECYRESLLLSFEQDQVQKLDAVKQSSRSQQWTDKRTYLSKKYTPFLSQINFRQQKVNQNTHEETIQMMDSRRCEICSLKIFPDKRQCYIQCSKCRHGGHFQHIIKWYNNYQNCPNVNCSCVCN